jgi:hypothetical protein
MQSGADTHPHVVIQEQLLAEIRSRIAELRAQCQSIHEVADALANERSEPTLAKPSHPEPLRLVVDHLDEPAAT